MGNAHSSQVPSSLHDAILKHCEQIMDELHADSPSLTQLELSGYQIGSQISRGCDLLKKSTHLAALDLSYNGLGATGAAVIADVLTENTSIVELSLAGNSIGDRGCDGISAALERSNTTLRALSLYNNSLTDHALLGLANMIQYNVSLMSLNLDGNAFSPLAVKVLHRAVINNEHLEALKLPRSSLEGSDPTLVEEINDRLRSNKEHNARRHATKLAIEHKRIAREQKLAAEEAARKANQEKEAIVVREEYAALQKQLAEDETHAAHTSTAARSMSREEQHQNEVQRAIEQAYSWRDKLTLNGTLVREWRNGFTIMRTKPGDPPGASPSVSSELPRRLKACWCDPPDATVPYAKTLHYHCKYEKSGDIHVDEDNPLHYHGCKGSGHICATVGFYAKPLPDLSAANFFSSQHPSSVQ